MHVYCKLVRSGLLVPPVCVIISKYEATSRSKGALNVLYKGLMGQPYGILEVKYSLYLSKMQKHNYEQ